MKNTNILIVEDESIVAMELKSYIQKLGYCVERTCSNAKDAVKILDNKDINIVMMDINIKGELDGIETAIIVKDMYPDIEIIFLTAHLDDYNVDRAIELNPVAYLAKPFNREELRVFLKIALHKIEKKDFSHTQRECHIVLDSEFSYDCINHILFYYDEIITLTKKENTLLELLLENKNNLVDFYIIDNAIWPDKDTNNNTIRTLIKRLRQKLKHKFIETVSSRGYRLIINNMVENTSKEHNNEQR